MSKPCPLCEAPMTLQTQKSVEVDVCPQGHGVWLDQKELFTLTEKARLEEGTSWFQDLLRREQHPERFTDRTLTCPVSGQEMKRDVYEGVQVDWSPGHGVWLDAGELEAILNNLRLDNSYLRGFALRLRDLRY